MSIKILLADDHSLVRNGLKSLLGSETGIEVVAEAENGLEVLSYLERNEVDVILLDITMPKMNGMEAAEIIRKNYPGIGIIFLSMHEEPEYVIKCVKIGANSYLPKNVEKEELILAINKAYKGERYFNTNISLLMAEGLNIMREKENEKIDLTPREIDVLKCVADGLSTKQIADKLCISVRTVETHRLNLLKKFDVQNSTELIKEAISRKIIEI
jgi:DNA-binding NarL/FixJ family response regulator